MFVSLVIRVN